MSKKMSPISFFSLQIELRLEGKKIGRGTGFLYQPKGKDKVFLVTNYHVITASSPKEPSVILEGYPDCPDEISISVLSRKNHQPFKIGYSLKKGADPTWVEHKDREKGVDIVAIPIELPEDAMVINQRKLNLIDNINFEIGSDLFIVGFPFGFGAGDFFPIWKRGTVASEPLFKPEGLQKFYIDSYTNPGMSGSPVFAFENREMFSLEGEEALLFKKYENGEISPLDFLRKCPSDKMVNLFQKKHMQLVGIYSGRIFLQNEKDPNIGIVWQKQLIDEMFLEPVIVKHPFPHE